MPIDKSFLVIKVDLLLVHSHLHWEITNFYKMMCKVDI